MNEKEKHNLWTAGSGWEVECRRLKERLEEVEASEERLAEIVRRSLNLRVFVFENPRAVANGYYIDAKVALEKRPSP